MPVREFKTRTAAWLPYVFGGCFGSIGLIAAIIGVIGVTSGGGSGMLLPLLIGLLFVVIGIGMPIGSYFFGKSYTITCRPEGFNVRTVNKRKGTEQNDYRWEEVTSTNYEEFHSRSHGRRGSSQTQMYFTVETSRGRAFRVSRSIGDFAGLITLFNQMTPQLPYIWQPQAGFNVSFGILSAGRRAYAQVPRDGGAAPVAGAQSTPIAPPPIAPPPNAPAPPPPPPPSAT